MMLRLRISSESLRRIEADAAADPTQEACGLLVGSGDAVAEVVRADNVASTPAVAFEIDPAVLFASHRAARSRGQSVIGCYHSHPSGPALPSPRDIAAAEAGALWLILGQGRIAAFQMRRGGYDPVEIVVAAD